MCVLKKAHQEILIEFLYHHPHSIVCSWSESKQYHWMYYSSWGKQQMSLCDLEISRHEPVSELSMPYTYCQLCKSFQKEVKDDWRNTIPVKFGDKEVDYNWNLIVFKINTNVLDFVLKELGMALSWDYSSNMDGKWLAWIRVSSTGNGKKRVTFWT